MTKPLRVISLWAALAVLACPIALLAVDPEPDPSELPRIPPKSPEEALKSFTLRPGFKIELAAAEPELNSPIAIAFDSDLSLFVVEMRGYSERRNEEMCRIRRLTDEDGDGRYEKATVYVDKLKWPTGVVCWDGGIFIAVTPDILYCKDTNGDGVAEVRQTVFTGFGEGAAKLNVQALVNGLTWGVDHRIYGATAGNAGNVRRPEQPASEAVSLRGSDFSFDPRKLDLRRESGTAQYGLTMDDFGQRYVCSNSRHLVAAMYSYPANLTGALPNALVDIPVDGAAAEVYRQSGVEPWRVVRTRWRIQGLVRGVVEGGGRDSGYFTSASGLGVYRGDALPAEFYGNVFVGDVGSNLVHRKVIKQSASQVKLEAHRAPGEEKVEFLTSPDNWFRPVFSTNGPDGALYLVDMYRETIEHPDSLPPTIKQHLDLNSGNDRGRLWRIVPEGFKRPALASLKAMPTPELVAKLEHPNGWTRDTAARVLDERADAAAIPLLKTLAASGKTPVSRLQAIYALKAQNALEPAEIAKALGDADPQVRRHAIRLSASLDESTLAKLAADANAWVRFETALRLLEKDQAAPSAVMATLLEKSAGDRWISLTVASAAKAHGSLAEVVSAQGKLADAAGLLQAASVNQLDATLAQSLRPLLDRARAAYQDAAVAGAERAAAAWFVTLDTAKTTPEELWAMVDSGQSSLASVGLEALQRKAGWQAGALERWSGLTSTLRAKVLARLNAAELLAAVDAKTIAPQEIDFQRRQALRTDADAKIREKALALFGEAATGTREQVAQQFRPALNLTGDMKAGDTLFTERCAVCHRPNTLGITVGPETATFRNKGSAMLLENILAPNKEVAPQYFTWQADMKTGERYLGMLTEESPQGITLRMAGGAEIKLARADVKQLICLNVSMMPEGLETGLTVQQMADLLAYLALPVEPAGK